MLRAKRKNTKDLHLRIIPQIIYYLGKKQIPRVIKGKYELFATGGYSERIYLFSNSLEHMGYFRGHMGYIYCLARVSNSQLASGSKDKRIKIWDLKYKSIICTLFIHTDIVSAISQPISGVLVSGSFDKSLIIWEESVERNNYIPKYIIKEHTSMIKTIIPINNREILTREWKGNIRIWDIDSGLCIIHIKNKDLDTLTEQMKKWGEYVAFSGEKRLSLWGAANNWETPIRDFKFIFSGHAFEYLSKDLFIRGGNKGELRVYSSIRGTIQKEPIHVNISNIRYMLRIAHGILAIVAHGNLKVIDPYIDSKCYFIFKDNLGAIMAIINLN